MGNFVQLKFDKVEHSLAADSFENCQSMKYTVVPVTLSPPTNISNNSTHDTISSKDPRLSSVLPSASAELKNQQSPSSVPVEGQCQSQTFASPLSVKSEGETTGGLIQPDANLAVDMVSSRSSALVEVAYDELQQRQGANSIQATQSNQKETWKSSEDGYSWRKYGQKHIKGSEFPRSYYRCSHPNCHAKKQVERSQNGCITDVLYKGQHDHPKPWSSSHVAANAMPSSQEERYNGVSFSNNTEDKTPNGHGETSPQAKQDGGAELSLVLASENNIERVGKKVIRVRDVVENDDDPESKRRRKLNTYSSYRSKDPQHEQSRQAIDCQSQANLSSCSIVDVNATISSHELTPLSGNVPNSAVDVIASRSIVPCVESEDLRQRSDGDLQPMQHDHKEPSRFVTAEKLCGDGYNWRKYGQKQIKGSESPRSYYRCTHPNCKVKKQVERSHDGQDAEIIYKGEHDHPKPQPSSHMTVGRILSLQEDGSARVSSLSGTEDKSSNEHSLLTPHTDLNGIPEVSPITASDSNVLGDQSKSMQIDDQVECKDDSESNNIHHNLSKEINTNASADSKDKQDKLSVEVQGQCQSQTLVSSPSAKKKRTDASSLELTPSTPNSNPPVYMVTPRGIVPVEVDSYELRQRQSSDVAVQATESDQNGISIAMTERLLENAYHWRKYGQKNIKGSEFPRSYYRCTHPNCSVKMQLERSHDGRVREIIYKGKHDHPKPQPISRMASGAILSLDEERSDTFSLTSTEEKPSNRHVQTPLHPNPNGLRELSLVTARDDNVECVGVKSNRTTDEVENDSDPEFKNRKDTSDLGSPVVKSPKEPRLVVETLTESDVVDDGYRWQKYGRKMVKGNPYPRNYYRCSNAACPVKKHVERASHNPKAVITTYEGKHNHDIPAPRTISQDLIHRFASNDMLVTPSEENDTISLDAGIATNSSPEQRSVDKQKIVDVVPRQVDSDNFKVIKRDPVSTQNGDSIDTTDPDKSRKDQGESFSFVTPSLNHSSNPEA